MAKRTFRISTAAENDVRLNLAILEDVGPISDKTSTQDHQRAVDALNNIYRLFTLIKLSERWKMLGFQILYSGKVPLLNYTIGTSAKFELHTIVQEKDLGNFKELVGSY